MLYNDIAIDGLIKRAARQAAVETVYMLKQAAGSMEESKGNMRPSTAGERAGRINDMLDRLQAVQGDPIIENRGIKARFKRIPTGTPMDDNDEPAAEASPSAWDSILEHLGNNAFTYGGGIGGAGIGALLGDNPNQKLLYALLGGGGGAGLGALADYLRK